MSAGRRLEQGALKEALTWLFDEAIFTSCKRHGNASWSFAALVTMALVWAWGDGGLRERFQGGLEILTRVYRRRQWGATYQGFLKLLRRWSGPLLSRMQSRLRERMQEVADGAWTIAGWVVLAVDGTRVAAARTRANEAHFARPAPGRKRVRKSSRRRRAARPKQRLSAGPQVWLTVLWHVGLGLLWDWRQGPSGASERAHLLDMLDRLPPGALLVADAGFSGYECWRSLDERGHAFVIRVGGNVRLLRGLGYVREHDGIVYLWPDRVRRQKQPPLVLRRFEFHDGRRSVQLVTNVPDAARLSQRQALAIYRRRWGVEVFIRTLKQTFGRAKLRSHAPHNVELELDWSLVALASLELLAVRELLACGRPPGALGTAAALRVLRHALEAATVGVDVELGWRLAAPRGDGYRRRQKSIRIWPRKKTETPLGTPRICYATLEQIEAAHDLRAHAA